jgi:hypothetical protein
MGNEKDEAGNSAAESIKKLCDDALKDEGVHVIVLVTNGHTGKNDIFMLNGNLDIAAYITKRSNEVLEIMKADCQLSEGAVLH